VQSVVESRKGENLFMTIILEQNVGEEHIRTRKLQMLAGASHLATCMGRDRVIKQIRQWIETTEGDGALPAGSKGKPESNLMPERRCVCLGACHMRKYS
jgi:hypothetical protein